MVTRQLIVIGILILLIRDKDAMYNIIMVFCLCLVFKKLSRPE